MYRKISRIHMIGVGGIGMSGIAQLLKSQGYDVSGSDLKKSESTRRLENQGIKVFYGHVAGNIHGAELVVYSSAVMKSNPEYEAAKAKHIPAIPRAEMLAELMRLKYGIAIAGAHGKTTTTSMIAWVLLQAGLDPTVVVGGKVDHFGGNNARLGQGDFLVAEADESDGSFRKLSPSIAVVTNIDREHMDHYGSEEKLLGAFHGFLDRLPFYGLAILNGDDPKLKAMESSLSGRIQFYGQDPAHPIRLVEYQPTEKGSLCKVRIQSHEISYRLKVPGIHNAYNSLAALAVAHELSVSLDKAAHVLEEFQGVHRRFHWRGKIEKMDFIDDYAHHPTEIQATLKAAKERYPHGKIRVLFQPHRYSRVADLWDEFSRSFESIHEAALTPIYAAGESPLPNISTANLVLEIQKNSKVHAKSTENPLETIQKWLSEAQEGDVVLTLGAGDLPHVYQKLF